MNIDRQAINPILGEGAIVKLCFSKILLEIQAQQWKIKQNLCPRVGNKVEYTFLELSVHL